MKHPPHHHEDLIYANAARCPCGAMLAYAPDGESGDEEFGYWDCSSILLGNVLELNREEGHTQKVYKAGVSLPIRTQ